MTTYVLTLLISSYTLKFIIPVWLFPIGSISKDNALYEIESMLVKQFHQNLQEYIRYLNLMSIGFVTGTTTVAISETGTHVIVKYSFLESSKKYQLIFYYLEQRASRL